MNLSFKRVGLIGDNSDSGYALAPSVNKPSTKCWKSSTTPNGVIKQQYYPELFPIFLPFFISYNQRTNQYKLYWFLSKCRIKDGLLYVSTIWKSPKGNGFMDLLQLLSVLVFEAASQTSAW